MATATEGFRPAGRATHRITALAGLLAIAALMFSLTTASKAQASTDQLDGVNVHSLWWENSSQDIDKQLDLAHEAGAKIVRADFGWSTAEMQGKGQWDSTYVNRAESFADKANARGMKVLFTLVGTPCWAASAPDTVKQGCQGSWWSRGVTAYPPTNMSDYADAIRYLATRYRGKVYAWEIWNEPNIASRFWNTPNPAADYAALVKAAYPAAKQGDPNALVVAGAVAAADRPFVEQLYAAGIKGYYDVLSIHPYNEWRDPSDQWHPQWKQYTFLPGTEWVHAAQVAAGDSKPLWLTEYGWTTVQNHAWSVTEAQQAAYIKEAVEIQRGLPYVKAGMVYELRNTGTDANDFESNFGLVRRDYTKKPAFNAFKEATQETDATPPSETPPPTETPPSDPPSGYDPPTETPTPTPPTPTPPPATKPPVTTKPPTTTKPSKPAPKPKRPARSKPKLRLAGFSSKRGGTYRASARKLLGIRATAGADETKVVLTLKHGSKVKQIELKRMPGQASASLASFTQRLKLGAGKWKLCAVGASGSRSQTLKIKVS